MIEYELSKIPNQKFNTNIGSNNFEFTFRSFRGIIYVSAKVNGSEAYNGIRATPNTSLFGGKVNDVAGGIFKFICNRDDYPSYENFDGSSCKFVYVPNEEIS